MSSNTYEGTLNHWLAEALSGKGLEATPESKQGGGKRLDVEVNLDGIRIALEAEQGFGKNKQKQAIKEADGRLRDDLADCAVAICYPDGLRSADELARCEVIHTLRTPKERPPTTKTNWTQSTLDQLASVIRRIPQQLGEPDEVASFLSGQLDRSVRRLSEGQKRDLANAVDLRIEFGKDLNKRLDQAAKRAMLVIATAVMFHAQLDKYRDQIPALVDNRVSPPRLYAGDWPPPLATDCAESEDPVGDYFNTWDLWLVVDYRPIFATARKALSGCAQDLAFTVAVRLVARAAIRVARNAVGLRHDLLGRIFHKVLESARHDGSYYTTTAAATFLANLAIRQEDCDWSDADAMARIRITDPACGTGTLLMAAGERIRDLSVAAREDRVSRALIERVLTGYDVNMTATHLAATTLGLLSPTTAFRDMKIGRALLGVFEGKAYIGSLEFLSQEGLSQIQPWPTGVEQLETAEEITEAEPADLVIMNPPFTRDSLRYDQFPPDEEEMLKNREKEIFQSLESGIHRSHSGGGFLHLAEYIAKPDSATVAVVLPVSGATNYSTRLVRMYLARKFHIEVMVTSHDPKRVYFSENTDIGEMLVVFRRWSGQGEKPPTRVINLYENPATPAEAISVSQDIINNNPIKGTLQEWPRQRIAEGNWGAVQFLSPYLCESFHKLRNGEMFETRGLGAFAKIGPAGQGIRGAFDRVEVPDKEAMRALWFHKTNVTQKMLAETDSYIRPKPGKKKQASNLWVQRGKLMLVTHARLNTVRCFSVRLNEAALGSLWVPCKFTADIRDVDLKRIHEEMLEKATCVYLNSTIGVLAILGDRRNKIPSYPHFSMADLKMIPVPDFDVLDEQQLRHLVAAFDAMQDSQLLPLQQSIDCSTRRALDEAVISALNVRPDIVTTIRRELCREPSVTNKPYEKEWDSSENNSPQLSLWS